MFFRVKAKSFYVAPRTSKKNEAWKEELKIRRSIEQQLRNSLRHKKSITSTSGNKTVAVINYIQSFPQKYKTELERRGFIVEFAFNQLTVSLPNR